LFKKNSNRFITRAPHALELQLPGKDGYKMSQTHKKREKYPRFIKNN
jgi:hypothetical protein